MNAADKLRNGIRMSGDESFDVIKFSQLGVSGLSPTHVAVTLDIDTLSHWRRYKMRTVLFAGEKSIQTSLRARLFKRTIGWIFSV